MELTRREGGSRLAIVRKGAEEARRAIERWLSRRPWAQPGRKASEGQHLFSSGSRSVAPLR